ncbi:hypothetical protein [Flavobacterium hibernum]|uniref:Uncharacterized protein n=1 Tax=Flavobacterium hibernum TaxID=37752 RepID=A0A0D0EYK7_9FLAO|nr:hypothetical protein [Flavobacterium hibernum]KIO50737.1 hypothetical protein IW18_21600 [Flavobacterium hibernum]OXA85666.1 hypothetical protein B0A73_16145 [Flavobacterium hibernum]STO18583.1 Uncharacterised protein [Flavobacterium hibernum]
MKIILLLLISPLLFNSCQKIDRINYYTNELVTQKELAENGFYKYSYSTFYDYSGNKVIDTKFQVKYDMYSNVKPQKNEEGEICPSQLGSLFKLDSLKKKEMKDYLKNNLNNRIITYLFRNDTLFYKSIIVLTSDTPQKQIADLTSKEKITKYYNNLKIPVRIIIEDNLSSKEHPTLFIINKYKTSIQYSEKDKSYELFTNYLNDSIYYDILDTWYYGLMRNTHYFLKYNPKLFM